MFINLSNHTSKKWSEKQLEAARKWGEVVDIPFPAVPAEATEEEIEILAKELVEQIMKQNPDMVMCQGEFTLAFSVISKLKNRGIPVAAACSERCTIEKTVGEQTEKTAVFEFVKFRQY